MEVGAVKQAFNNELILLKKKLNQAKIQIIHKLTRKAKTFADKKAPEPLKEKLKRKAESAVNEVLIIKKIKPKDLARFAVTHKGQLNDHLNKPNVDQDKACARLLLHKSLQDKYKLIRTQFSSIPIEDLLMSREERRKLKKEEKEKLKNKRKEKELKRKQKEEKGKDIVNTEGVWDVEDVTVSDALKEQNVRVESDLDEDIEDEEKPIQNGNNALEKSDEDLSDNESDKELNDSQNEGSESDDEMGYKEKTDDEMDDEEKTDDEVVNEEKSSEDEIKVSKNSAIKTNKSGTKQNTVAKTNGTKNIAINNPKVVQKPAPKPKPKTKTKENKQNKNKNLNEKLLSRKFKKDVLEAPIPETKIVDPFFITATGENYMSVVEPRPPDEIKEVHKQGNRKLRRAAMFGHVPKIKPRQNNFAGDDNRSNRNSGFNKNNNSNRFGDRDNSDDKRNFTNKRFKFDRNEEIESKPEKLHPSWEAKKKQSGILPFQGKKIVFDES